MTTSDLNKKEFDIYYKRYINKLPKNVNLLKGFTRGKNNIMDFFKSIPKEKLNHSYAPRKWSVKEILQHLIDTERIFMYRCFRIARNDKTALASFDQNIYINPSNASNKSIETLLDEFSAVRENSISLINSLSDENLKYMGNSNGGAMSARAAAFIIIGHDIWHMNIIKEKYL